MANQQHRRRRRLLLLRHREESKLCSGEASWNERVFFPCKLLATPEGATHSLSVQRKPTNYVLITPYENVPSLWAFGGLDR